LIAQRQTFITISTNIIDDVPILAVAVFATGGEMQ
jgi:hypothetical protein